ncbi:MAG: putative MFS-type transporter [Rhodanobacteraceae bacterium]|jgi:MFS family permease|nr:MAG: putative MFS-type transporter [Rhodanobacteraceae bacterium]
MLRTLRPIASLLAGTALLLAGVGLLNTLIPLRGAAAGFPETLLGGLTSAYYVGYFIGTFAMPPLVRRIGHIRAFAFCAACAACIVLLYAFGTNPIAWLALRLLSGIVLVGLYAVIESWLNAQAPDGKRGAVFATYMVVNLGSLALGQQLLRIRGEAFVPFAVVALLVCAATLPVLATHQAQPQQQATPRLQLRLLFNVAPTAGLGAILTGLAMGAFWGLLPVYARDSGFDTAAIGNYMSIAIVGGAALQWPLGRLSDRHDRRIALALVAAAAALLALAGIAFGGREWPEMATIFLFGGMSFAIYPIVVAHLVDHAPPEDLLAASSSVLLVYGVGSALGPLVAGGLMGAFGAWTLFAWFALTHGVLAVYATWRYRMSPRTPADAPAFQPMLRTTPAALRLLRAAVRFQRGG